MPLVQKFIRIWPKGTTPIEIEDWVKTLPQSEQDVYWEGRRNGDRLRQIAIDEGRMILQNDAYEWRDKEAFDVGKDNDPTWEMYWRRWQAETGVICTSELIEE